MRVLRCNTMNWLQRSRQCAHRRPPSSSPPKSKSKAFLSAVKKPPPLLLLLLAGGESVPSCTSDEPPLVEPGRLSSEASVTPGVCRAWRRGGQRGRGVESGGLRDVTGWESCMEEFVQISTSQEVFATAKRLVPSMVHSQISVCRSSLTHCSRFPTASQSHQVCFGNQISSTVRTWVVPFIRVITIHLPYHIQCCLELARGSSSLWAIRKDLRGRKEGGREARQGKGRQGEGRQGRGRKDVCKIPLIRDKANTFVVPWG